MSEENHGDVAKIVASRVGQLGHAETASKTTIAVEAVGGGLKRRYVRGKFM
jgi:hypothetical protein